jgi:hypothetical protein
MNKEKLVLFGLTLALIGGGGALLGYLHKNQKLGEPGVRTEPLADVKKGSLNVHVLLPALVLDYTSEELPQASIVTNVLPHDTSFGQRLYKATDGFEILANVVLMGSDRTSLHKPQICLEGNGWHIDQAQKTDAHVPVQRPHPYDLPVAKLTTSRDINLNGQTVPHRGIYVYYYVADNAISAGTYGVERMWLMARDMLRTGVLQRWAYVTYFAVCAPGQEDATFERMKKFIGAAAPELQLTPRAEGTETAKR